MMKQYRRLIINNNGQFGTFQPANHEPAECIDPAYFQPVRRPPGVPEAARCLDGVWYTEVSE